MISDYSRDLLRSGLIELKAGNRDSARRYLDRALYMSGDHEVLAEGWYWMSQLSEDPAEKRRALENCLSHDLRHARARRALAVLDGKLKPEEIIDPDRAASRAAAQGPADAQRFVCPKCGGRMAFSPDGQSLACEYCTRGTPLRTSGNERGGLATGTAQPNKDFLVAMATARGHGKPLREQVFHCQGCAAEFILAPGQLSITCPYCGSPHVVSFEKSADLLAPDGIVPHAFDQRRAASLLSEWLRRKRRSQRGEGEATASRGEITPRGLYLPLWTFDLGGTIDYTGEVLEEEEMPLGRRAPRKVQVSDSYPVMLRHLPIPASRKLSGPFVRLLPTFDLSAVQPYDPRYLADWPAELYDIPMAEASLDARSQGLVLLKRDMAARLAPVRLVSVSSANLTVESFRLNLLPVWMAEAGSHLMLVNGQSGEVCSEAEGRPRAAGSLAGWLADLIRE